MMRRIASFMLLAVLLGVSSAHAERFLVIPKGGPSGAIDADITRLGGAVVSRLVDRIEVEISPEAAAELSRNAAIAYVQPVDGSRLPQAKPTEAVTKHDVTVESSPPTWSSGEYKYDGSGNIYAIGANAYAYDANSRLSQWTLSGVGSHAEEYTYDPYGNMTSIKVNGMTTSIGVDPVTNRLTNHDYTSSGPGNLVDPYTDQHLTYDALNMVTTSTIVGLTTKYVYTPDDERIGALRTSTSTWTWSIRGADHQILRQYSSSDASPSTPWLWLEDYVYRDGLLLAAVRQPELGGRRHFHLDHLGTPRLITADDGSQIAAHDFTPWGFETTSPCQETNQGYDRNELRVFTGHERDYRISCGDTQVLDYMHARYFNGNVGRFLSVDPYIGRDTARKPSKWNRYAYGANNPVRYIDPNGEDAWDAVNGFFNAIVNDAGLTARATGNSDFEIGQLNGDRAAVVGGFILTTVSATDAIITAPTGVGALAFGTVAVASAAFTVNAAYHLSQDNNPQSSGGGGPDKSSYDNTTTGRSVQNRSTNVTPDDFGKNLEKNGFTRSVSQDGKVILYKKGDITYAVRPWSKSTGGPTADMTKNGQLVLKIRLGH